MCTKLTVVSVKLARSIGRAIFAGKKAIFQLWLILVAPVLGGIVAALVYGILIQRPEKITN